MIKFFNSYTGKKNIFRPLEQSRVKIYTCGPTVYDYCHIGNLRSFLFADLVKRFLTLEGFAVVHVMNITDVDDKTIAGAAQQRKSLAEFTSFYIGEFLRDIESVRIHKPTIMPRATQHIDDMVELIEKLLAKNVAYVEKDGIYFDISKFKRYGKLSKLVFKNLKTTERVKNDNYEKDEVRDFALWKAWSEDDGDVSWITRLGRGRPGWHIECSAMSVKYLGESFDIHTGGIDLKFPHHENELAQCISAGFIGPKYWLHNEHLFVDGKKMSKSLGNYLTIHDIIGKGYDPVAFRYLCLSSHYRTQLNFTFQSLESAQKTIANINSFMHKLRSNARSGAKKYNDEISFAAETCREEFMKALEDDLNTPLALSSLFAMMNIVNRNIDANNADAASLSEVEKLMNDVNSVFDFFVIEEPLSEDDMKLIEEREEARRRKDYERADHIREILRKKGILIEDTPYGVSWRRQKIY